MTQIILPTYITKLPSTGKSVKFRPFTVKEEKSLLLALQEALPEVTVEALKNVIKVCTHGEVDPNKVPYYDIEFLFLQIRGKSVGETVEFVGSCECSEKAKTEFIVDITSPIIEPKPTGNIKIKIPDTNYTIEMRHPTLDDFTKQFDESEQSGIEVVANCIIQVFTDDEVMSWSRQETLEFVESMTSKQQKDIAQFLKDMPMVKIPMKYVCQECSKEHLSFMSGFSNFFI